MSVASQVQRKALTSDQWDMIRIIEREFRRARLPPEFTAAAIVNAYHESKLNPGIQSGVVTGGVREDSVGLFQLYIYGAGADMVLPDGTDLRTDPVLNTQRIIQEVHNYGDEMWKRYKEGERRISVFAALFCQDIERPANKQKCWTYRGDVLALEFFPKDAVDPYFYKTWWFWAIMLGVGTGVYAYREQALRRIA